MGFSIGSAHTKQTTPRARESASAPFLPLVSTCSCVSVSTMIVSVVLCVVGVGGRKLEIWGFDSLRQRARRRRAAKSGRARTRQLVAKQPQVQRERLEVAQVVAGAADGHGERGAALPQRVAVALLCVCVRGERWRARARCFLSSAHLLAQPLSHSHAHTHAAAPKDRGRTFQAS